MSSFQRRFYFLLINEWNLIEILVKIIKILRGRLTVRCRLMTRKMRREKCKRTIRAQMGIFGCWVYRVKGISLSNSIRLTSKIHIDTFVNIFFIFYLTSFWYCYRIVVQQRLLTILQDC